MWAAAADPPISPENVSFTESMFPFKVTIELPVAGDPVGGTSLAPVNVVAKIVAADTVDGMAKRRARTTQQIGTSQFIRSGRCEVLMRPPLESSHAVIENSTLPLETHHLRVRGANS